MLTRAALTEAAKFVPSAKIAELDIVRDVEEAERAGIRSTPTVIVLKGDSLVIVAVRLPT